MQKRFILSAAFFVAIVGIVVFMHLERARENRLPSPPANIVYTMPILKNTLPIEQLEKKSEQEPGMLSFNDLAGAYYLLGKHTGKQEYFEKAKFAIAKSLVEQPTSNKGARVLTIKLLQAEHKFEESLEKISDLDKEFHSPEHTGPLKITALVALGRAAEAKQIADVLLNAVPTSSAYVLAGSVAEEAGEPKRAVELLSKAIELEEPGEAYALTFPRAILGRLYLRRGQFADARKCLEAALAIDPDDVISLRLLGHLEAFNENWQAAETALVHAISVYSDADILVQLSRVKRLQGQTKAADDMLRTAEEKFRDDIARSHYGHRLQMAEMLLEKKATEEAAKIAEADLASRQHPFVKIILAKALAESGRADRATEILQPVLASTYEHPYLHLVAGEVARIKGDSSQAAREFSAAKDLNPRYRESCEYCPLF